MLTSRYIGVPPEGPGGDHEIRYRNAQDSGTRLYDAATDVAPTLLKNVSMDFVRFFRARENVFRNPSSCKRLENTSDGYSSKVQRMILKQGSYKETDTEQEPGTQIEIQRQIEAQRQ